MGASDDVTHIGPNAFSQFANDCQLIDKRSEWCKATHFDQLFIAVDASSSGGKTNEKHNRKKALNRRAPADLCPRGIDDRPLTC